MLDVGDESGLHLSRASHSRHQDSLSASSTSDQPQPGRLSLIRLAMMRIDVRLATYKYVESTHHSYLLVTNPPQLTRRNSIIFDYSKMHTKINIAVLLAAAMTTLAENVAIETWQFEQITARGYPWAVVTSAP
jgi:hypothetical protein